MTATPSIPTTMRAAVATAYGPPDVLQVVERAVPTPGADQVLVRVRAAAVTSADSRIRAARFPRGFGLPARLAFGVRRPRRPVLGSALAGEVVAVGRSVVGFTPGDRVCGMMGVAMGAHAEYAVVSSNRLVFVPDAVSFDDAAGVLFGGTTALYFLREKATVTGGTTVLVNGASGAIGTNAIQLAVAWGATVTAVCSGSNAALVRDLGAAHVIDHTTQPLSSVTERYDVVLDTVGNLSIADGRRLIADDGVVLLAVADLGQTLRARGNVKAGTSREKAADFGHLVDLVAAGALRVVHDLSVPLDDVADAHRRVDTGHKRGNVIVRP